MMKNDKIEEIGSDNAFDISPNSVPNSQNPTDIIKEVNQQMDFFEDVDDETNPNFSDPIPDDDEDGEDEDSDESGEEEGGEEEEEVEEDLLPVLANALKSKGFLPQDTDLEGIKSEEDLINIYEDKISEEAYSRISATVDQALKDRGVTDYHLNLAKLLANGVSDSEVATLVQYKDLSQKKIDDLQVEDVVKYCEAHLKETGVSKGTIKRILDTIEVDDDALKESFEDANKYFVNKVKAIEKEQTQFAEAELQRKEQFASYQKEVLTKVLKEGKVRGESIPDVAKFTKMVNEYDTSVNIEGKDYPTTKYGAFLVALNNDPELKLWAFKEYVFANEIKETIKEESAQSAETNLLKGFKGIRIKDSRANKKKTNTTNKNSAPAGKVYLMSGGAFSQKV